LVGIFELLLGPPPPPPPPAPAVGFAVVWTVDTSDCSKFEAELVDEVKLGIESEDVEEVVFEILTLELDLVGEVDVVELDVGVLGVDMGVALTDARWTTDGGEGEVVTEDVVGLDGLGTAEATGIGMIGEGEDTVPEDDVLEVDEDGSTNKTGPLDRDVEVVELLPDEVTEGLEEVLDVDGGTETDVDEDVLLVWLEVLDMVGVMELELVDRLELLDEVVEVDGTLEELDEEETLQPGVVKNEVTQSVFAALRK
jgi:hypothetical protein